MTTRRKFTLGLLLSALLLAGTAALPLGAHAAPAPADVGKTVFLNPQDGTVRKLVNTDRSPIAGTPEEAAATFLSRNAERLFGTPAADKNDGVAVGDVVLRDVRTTSSLSGFHVWKQAYLAGVPVWNAYVVTHMTHDGRVIFVTSDLGRPRFSLAATRAALTARDALQAAAALIGGDGQTQAVPTAELVVVRAGGRDVLAWRTVTTTWNPYGDWEIFIDAVSGREVARRDLLIVDGRDPKPARMSPPVADKALPPYDPATAKRLDGSGFVFIANPLNNHPERYSWRDGSALLDGARDMVTLRNLDGSGYLRGPWVEVFNSDATRALEPTNVFQYSSTILNGHFQEVNVYYHINFMQEYIQNDLGIPNARNRLTNCYAHQGEDDNSDYSPSLDRIRYGDGGVDDSDDGEIVCHEYGHAIHNAVVPGFVYSGECGAISEGFGDYLSGSLGGNALSGEWDATAYNAGPPPFLRRLDTPKHYPESMTGEVHDDGEVIDGAWWNLRTLVGGIVGDRLVIEGMFYTGTTATFQDYADGVVAADQALYAGAHIGYIYQAFGQRGIGPTYLLAFTHTPLGDTENTAGPYPVVCTIEHTSPITGAGAVQLHYALPGDASFTDVVMNPTANFNEWAGQIPGPGVNGQVRYYLTVTDDMAVASRLPTTADTYFSFIIGPDSQPPVIVHTPVRSSYPLLQWPPTVSADVTDNLSVASVSFAYTINGTPQPVVAMTHGAGHAWSAPFPEPAGSVHVGDQFVYTITAVDGSSQALVATSGPHSFTVIQARGVVLIIDDNLALAASDEKWTRDKQPVPLPAGNAATLGASAQSMASILDAAGFVVVRETVATTDPATWPSYSFIVSSSGNNTGPVAVQTYQDALVAYVAAGHKLLVEGGEVAYDAISSPGYPAFASSVVHGYDWDCDSCGGLAVDPAHATHPIMTSPWAIPASLALTYAGYGDQDGFKENADATVIMRTAGSSYTVDAGLLVYDNNSHPASAQIVNYAFNFAALTDPTAAAHLLENTATFLTAVEEPGTARIQGTCYLVGAPDNSGVTVTCNPGGLTAVTGGDGHYAFANLFAGTYHLTATKPGYGSTPQTVVLGTGQTANVDFGLGLVQEYQFCDTPTTGVSIPDNNTTGITRSIMVTQAGILSNIYCSMNITHTWKGDLTLDLTSPAGTTVRLHNRTGGSADNIITTYDSLTQPDGPGTMNDFDGQNPVGLWTLKATDLAAGDIGVLHSWCLDLFVTEEVVATSATPPVAAATLGGVSLTWSYNPSVVDGCHVYRSVGAGPEVRLTTAPLTSRDGRIVFTDPAGGLASGTIVGYRYALLKDGREIGRSDQVTVTLGGGAPLAFRLSPVYPNPFNPQTNVKFAVPRPGHVAVRVYDLAGRLVRTLVDADLPAAEHAVVWDGRDDAGQPAASGTYYCRMTAEGFRDVQKMTLVK